MKVMRGEGTRVQSGEKDAERKPRHSLQLHQRRCGEDHFCLTTSERTRGNGLKMHCRRFRLNIRNNFLSWRKRTSIKKG